MAWRVHVENLIRFGYLGHRMYVANDYPDGSYDTMECPILIKHEAGTFTPEASAFMDDSKHKLPEVRAFLQAMSDAAWEIGIKPKQIADHSSELKATKYHLEDMRKLALKG